MFYSANAQYSILQILWYGVLKAILCVHRFRLLATLSKTKASAVQSAGSWDWTESADSAESKGYMQSPSSPWSRHLPVLPLEAQRFGETMSNRRTRPGSGQ